MWNKLEVNKTLIYRLDKSMREYFPKGIFRADFSIETPFQYVLRDYWTFGNFNPFNEARLRTQVQPDGITYDLVVKLYDDEFVSKISHYLKSHFVNRLIERIKISKGIPNDKPTVEKHRTKWFEKEGKEIQEIIDSNYILIAHCQRGYRNTDKPQTVAHDEPLLESEKTEIKPLLSSLVLALPQLDLPFRNVTYYQGLINNW